MDQLRTIGPELQVILLRGPVQPGTMLHLSTTEIGGIG